MIKQKERKRMIKVAVREGPKFVKNFSKVLLLLPPLLFVPFLSVKMFQKVLFSRKDGSFRNVRKYLFVSKPLKIAKRIPRNRV